MTTMTNWKKTMRIACVTVAVGVLVAASSHAYGVGHKNHLTFNRPVALPGVVLPAGTYTFDLADSNSALDIVIVRDAVRSKVMYLGFANTVERPRAMPTNTALTFHEAPANEPPPIAAWYEIGDSLGHEFLYR
jgi:hypothetical protein